MAKANLLTVTRQVGETVITATAVYDSDFDGWFCMLTCNNNEYEENRTPNQTGSDVWVALQDMIDLAGDAVGVEF